MKAQRKKWSLKDKVTVAVCLSFSVGGIFVGMAFMFSNLRMSDHTFVEYPLLAILVSGIVPLIAMAIKFISNFIETGKNRKNYAKGIGLLTCGSAVYWAWLYAQVYTGIAVDYGAEPHGLGSALVFWQLSTEILAAAALALVAEDIYMRYYPDSYEENPERVAIERAINKILQQQQKAGEELRNVCGQLTQLKASRQATINERIVHYICLYENRKANNNAFANT